MTDFDAYHQLLGIPPEEQPPHYYRLLGIALYESNESVIANAASRQTRFVRTLGGDYADVSQKILNELAKAKLCLLSGERRAAYNAELAARLGAAHASLPAAKPTEHQHSWLIGSGDECDLIVDRPSVSRNHCRLTEKPDGFVLEDLNSKNGTYLNRVRLQKAAAVSPLDWITLGKKTRMPWPADALKPTGLRVVYIGADPANDVVLDDPTVSAHHARVIIRDGVATLADLGSSNGTAIGSPDRRIRTTRLSPDDVVYFGQHRVPARELLGDRQ